MRKEDLPKEVIKAWLDGKTVQFKHINNAGWLELTDIGYNVLGNFNQDGYEWRIKPTIIKYRVALMRFPDGSYYTVSVPHTDNSCLHSHFVRWITECIEVEV